jgi:hypothetical protein
MLSKRFLAQIAERVGDLLGHGAFYCVQRVSIATDSLNIEMLQDLIKYEERKIKEHRKRLYYLRAQADYQSKKRLEMN